MLKSQLLKLNFESNDGNNDLSTLSLVSENYQNKNIQSNLQQSFQNFEDFVKLIGKTDLKPIDINQIRNTYKIEIQEIMSSSTFRKIFEQEVFHQKNLVGKGINHFCLDNQFKLFTQQDWIYIASILPLKTAEECQLKLLGLEKVSLQKIPWSQYEDQTLKRIICQKGALKWAETSKALHELLQTKHFRSSKQCRERWNNYLNPKLKKGDWINEEDIKLLQLAKMRGKRWAQISREMKGRNENTVKNRYNCLIKKAMKQKKNLKLMNIDIDINQNFKICQQELNLIDELLFQKQQILEDKLSVPKQYYENQNLFEDSYSNRNLDNYINLDNYDFQKKNIKLDQIQENNYDFNNYFTGGLQQEPEINPQIIGQKNVLFNLFSYEKTKKNELSFDNHKKISCNMDENFWNETDFLKNDVNIYDSFGQINQLQFSF